VKQVDNSIRYTPNGGFTGQDVCSYQICDNSNPAQCSSTTLTVDVGGVGPVAVDDSLSTPQNTAANINVTSNDLQGTSPLNLNSLSITQQPAHGSLTLVGNGVITYTPTPSVFYHGSDVFIYQICDLVGACDTANVAVTVIPNGPTANDDTATTAYLTAKNINVLANDVKGAANLNPASVSVTNGPASGATTSVQADGSITYTPPAGFVGVESFTYQVCDSSTPTALCDSASVTVTVSGKAVVLRYRLVRINYDILNHRIVATVQTQTADTAKVANVALGSGSTNIGPIISGPTTGASCDPSSGPGSCDQFHTITFSDDPCNIPNGVLVLNAQFVCSSGSAASTCGYINVANGGVYTLSNIQINYNACPSIVSFGVNDQTSFMRIYPTADRVTELAAPATMGDTLFGLISLFPTQGAQFQSVTLMTLDLVDVTLGNENLGNQLAATWMTLSSTLSQTSASNPQWQFQFVLDPNVFDAADTYYYLATLDLTFANTGVVKRIEVPVEIPGFNSRAPSGKSLRAQARDAERAPGDPQREAGVYSNLFRRQDAISTSAPPPTTPAVSGSSNDPALTGVLAAVAAIGGLIVIGLIVVIVLLFRRQQDQKLRSGDAPLMTAPKASGTGNDLDF